MSRDEYLNTIHQAVHIATAWSADSRRPYTLEYIDTEGLSLAGYPPFSWEEDKLCQSGGFMSVLFSYRRYDWLKHNPDDAKEARPADSKNDEPDHTTVAKTIYCMNEAETHYNRMMVVYNGEQNEFFYQSRPRSEHMSLLTVTVHELGHVFGLDHLPPRKTFDVMQPVLSTGLRFPGLSNRDKAYIK